MGCGALLFLGACSSPMEAPVTPAAAGPTLRIGLVADSQLQTRHTRDSVRMLSGKNEDEVVDVSLRPPALNELAEDLLDELLRKLIRDGRPDVVLYLGDAANNGCADEIGRAFHVLDTVRDATKVPIYFVLGNHDYLGAGNTTHLTDRTRLCDRPQQWSGKSLAQLKNDGGKNDSVPMWTCKREHAQSTTTKHTRRGRQIGLDNLPVTKFELMREVSCFNQTNGPSAWAYADHFGDRGAEEGARSLDCLGKQRHKEGWIESQHTNAGCFLSATLVRDRGEPHQVDMLLADTSDYFDKGVKTTFLGAQAFGLQGWMSTEGDTSQAQWFADRSKGSTPALRIIASHYAPDRLGTLFTTWSPWPMVRERLAAKLGPAPPHGQYWLHGHEHTWSDVTCVEHGPFMKFGVGSTTDHGVAEDGTIEPPHAALVSFVDGAWVEARRIEVEGESFDCTAVEEALGSFTRIRANGDTYSPVLKRSRLWQQWGGPVPYRRGEEARILLGLDKSYRDRGWTVSDEVASLQNLATFIDEFAVDASKGACHERPREGRCRQALEAAEKQARVCLALESSELEKKQLTRWSTLPVKPGSRVRRADHPRSAASRCGFARTRAETSRLE